MPRPPKGKGAANTPERDEALFRVLTALLEADKTLSTPIVWVKDGQGDLRFTCALDIDGVTEASFVLSGKAVHTLPDRKVTLGLRWSEPDGRGGHFERLEWRPIHGHTNKGVGPEELHFLLIEGTHHHSLVDNAAHPDGLGYAIQNNLPLARPIEPGPDWQNFLAVAAERWRIQDIVNSQRPPWQYELPKVPKAGENKE